jgi:hypothetical protein
MTIRESISHDGDHLAERLTDLARQYMRALVKLTLGHSLAGTLADDIAQACETLKHKGGLHELDRKRVKTGTGY